MGSIGKVFSPPTRIDPIPATGAPNIEEPLRGAGATRFLGLGKALQEKLPNNSGACIIDAGIRVVVPASQENNELEV